MHFMALPDVLHNFLSGEKPQKLLDLAQYKTARKENFLLASI